MKFRLALLITFKLLFQYHPQKGKLKILSLPLFSIILVAFCIFVPLAALSISNGFQFFTIDTYKKVYLPYNLNLHTSLDQNMLKISPDQVPYFKDFVIISGKRQQTTALIQSYTYENLKKLPAYHLLKEYLPLNSNEVILPQHMAHLLNVKIGSRIQLLSLPSLDTGSINTSYATVKGIVSFSNASLDSTLVIISNNALPDLLNYSPYTINQISAKSPLELLTLNKSYPSFTLNSLNDTPVIKSLLENRILMKVILLSISFICFFAVFITLQVCFLNNMKNLSILRVLGINQKDLSLIFLFHGILIGFLGIILGLTLTIFIIPHIQEIFTSIQYTVNSWADLLKLGFPSLIPPYWSFEMMPSSIFYVTKPPIKMIFNDFLLQTLVVMITVFLASILPSFKLENQDMISSMKYNN